MINRNLGDSETPDTWRPTADTYRDERIDAELVSGEAEVETLELAVQEDACG